MLIRQVAPLAGLVQVIGGACGRGCPWTGAVATHVARAAIATRRVRDMIASACRVSPIAGFRDSAKHVPDTWMIRNLDDPAGGVRRPPWPEGRLASSSAPCGRASPRSEVLQGGDDETEFPGTGR